MECPFSGHNVASDVREDGRTLRGSCKSANHLIHFEQCEVAVVVGVEEVIDEACQHHLMLRFRSIHSQIYCAADRMCQEHPIYKGDACISNNAETDVM